ncbi:MAG: glutamine--tRNA ligase/YqeY domain fusion protein [Clostridiales bacterium]|jgi:glutaminyl-tRNA synthetase|nr:glutamine--tRNA ligase/YqeY domain fusion protein [Clostridiales bacterium]
MGNFLEDIIEKDLADGKVKRVITRFPPEPNGYLHIGHAKSICLNYGLAKKYGGDFNMRFDDTNPVKEDDEFVNSIIADVRWLVDAPRVLYASDYFGTMYECALILINKGLAYVDDVTPEQMKSLRGTLTQKGTQSPNRDRPVEENLRLFDDMKNGKVDTGSLVLRAKIDMGSPNMNMRDPILYRVLKATHHRQKDKWCIYPMYDFAHPLEDAVEGVTHSVCTLEFEDHRPLYDWVLDNCWRTPRPYQYEFARLNIARTIMSKRYLKKLVDEKAVDGWDDPRMPTLAGFRRRGYTASAIREFCAAIGVAKSNGEVEAGRLEACARDEFNLTSERVMAVLEPLELVITNRPDGYREELNFEYALGGGETRTRKIDISNRLYIEKSDFELTPPPKYKRLCEGALVRLKCGYIVKCTGSEVGKDGEVKRVFAEIVEGTKSGEDNSGVKARGVIHWVNAENCVDITAHLYDYLLLDGDGDFSERLNPDSQKTLFAKAEKYLESAVLGKVYQFLRLGYFCVDCKNGFPHFNCTVGLKDSYKGGA